MKLYVFLDLDDTVFQTLRKCPAGADLYPAAVDREGTTNSWMTKKQRWWFDLFASSCTIIPTTARSFAAFRRVLLPFNNLAILDFGGVILLPDGSIDPEWDSQIRPQTRSVQQKLDEALDRVQLFVEQDNLDVYCRIICDFDMPLYLVMKQRDPCSDGLKHVVDSGVLSASEEWFVHFNDNNLSLVPSFLGKEHAVRFVIDKHLGGEEIMTVGMGDSFSDAAFLGLCDSAIVSKGSQLHRRLGKVPC